MASVGTTDERGERPTRADIKEALDDVRRTAGRLRVALPSVVIAATNLVSWPDTVLTPVIVTVAEAVGALDSAAHLLAGAEGGDEQ